MTTAELETRDTHTVMKMLALVPLFVQGFFARLTVVQSARTPVGFAVPLSPMIKVLLDGEWNEL